MSHAKPLSAALRLTRRQRKERQAMKAKARQRAYLREQGRHAEADFMLLTNYERLPASFRESFLSGYR